MKTKLKQCQETYRWPSYFVPAFLIAGGAKLITSLAAPATGGGGRGGGSTTLLPEDLAGGGKGGIGGTDAAMGRALDCKACSAPLSSIACNRRALRVASLISSTNSEGIEGSWLSWGSGFTVNGSYSGDPGCITSTASLCSSSHATWSANMSISISSPSASSAGRCLMAPLLRKSSFSCLPSFIKLLILSCIPSIIKRQHHYNAKTTWRGKTIG